MKRDSSSGNKDFWLIAILIVFLYNYDLMLTLHALDI